MRFVSGITTVCDYAGLNSLGSLKAAIASVQPDIIVPCDDGVVWQLHELYAADPSLQPLIEASIGSPAAFPIIRSRGALLETAKSLGIRIPETRTVRSEADLKSWCLCNPAVLKLDGTWGGSGVAITRNEAEAIAAYRVLSRPGGAGVAWKRWLINRDPLAIWSWLRNAETSVTIQEFIEGRPANTMFLCWHGEVLGIVSVEVLSAQGATGAATVVRLIDNPEIERAARLLASNLKLHGFHGLDFILEHKTGAAYLIELNPRSTQLGHLCLPGQGDLAGMMSAKLQGTQPEPPANPIDGSIVAFFPQAVTWNPSSEYLTLGYHDVPWEEPDLREELLRGFWPDRQLPARIYHHFRKLQKPEETRF